MEKGAFESGVCLIGLSMEMLMAAVADNPNMGETTTLRRSTERSGSRSTE